MPEIRLTTIINAPIERSFDLARSIEFHEYTTAKTGEKAIAGFTKGLIGLNDEVTWRARHFGVTQTLSSRISRYDRPHAFEDIMVRGAFKSIRHLHTFEFVNGQTVMKDEFVFESPFGILGQAFNLLVLAEYMRTFLLERNAQLKQAAESESWKRFLTA